MSWRKTIQEVKPSWKDTITEDSSGENPDKGANSAPKQDISTTLSGGMSPSELREKMIQKGQDDSIDFTAMAMGVAQGALMDFGDEIAGGVAAIPAALTPGKSYLDDYTKYRDIVRKFDEDKRKESPYSYGTGQVAGAIAPAVATMGASAPAAAASVGKLGLGQLAKQTAVAGLKTGALGAAQGGLQALGASKEIDQTALDNTIDGAVSGAVIGGGLGALGTAVPGALRMGGEFIGDIVQDSPRLRQTGLAFNEGLEQGTVLSTGEKARASMAARNSADVADTAGRIMAEDKRLGAEIGSLIKNADDAGVRISLDEPLSDAYQRVTNILKNDPNISQSPEAAKLVKKLIGFQNGTMSPTMTKEVVDELKAFTPKFGNKILEDVADNFQKGLSRQLDSQVSGLREAKDAFTRFRSAVPETVIEQGAPQKILNPATNEVMGVPRKFYGQMNEKEAKLIDGVEKLIKDVSNPNSSNIAPAQTMNALKDRMIELESVSPGTLKRMGFDSIDDMVADITKKGDMEAIRQQIQKPGIMKNISTGRLISGIAATAEGALPQMANAAGRVTRSVAAPVGKMSKAIFNAPDAVVRSLATKLTADPKLAPMGNLLLKAIDNKAGVGKNAALFSIMQNPEARKFVDLNFETPEDTE